ncbi:MAG: hypothetical protein PHH16_03415 [Candidatus Gracilibacteria bacterium]|nr:hypothetical protein [Candidatus Gracilibacteria bacterium]
MKIKNIKGILKIVPSKLFFFFGFFALFIGFVYATVLVFPNIFPSGMTSNGSFSTRFTHMFVNCPANEFLKGFDTDLYRICVPSTGIYSGPVISQLPASTSGGYPTAPTGQIAEGKFANYFRNLSGLCSGNTIVKGFATDGWKYCVDPATPLVISNPHTALTVPRIGPTIVPSGQSNGGKFQDLFTVMSMTCTGSQVVNGFDANGNVSCGGLPAISCNTAGTNFAGFTTNTYDGNMGGVPGANAKCAAEFPGSRIANLSEIKCSLPQAVWINDLPSGILSAWSDSHCYGWTSNSFSLSFNPYGAAVSPTGFGLIATNPTRYWMVSTCNLKHALACVYNPISGSCGTANGKTYTTTTAYGSDTQCANGTASSTAFPTQGGSVSWTCSGQNGGNVSGTCTASRRTPYQIYTLISAWGYTTPVSGSIVVRSGCAMGGANPNAELLGNALWQQFAIVACFNGSMNSFWELKLPGSATTMPWWQTPPAVFTGQSVTVGGSTYTFSTTGPKFIYGTINYTAGSTLSWSGNTLSASGPGGSGSLTFWQ